MKSCKKILSGLCVLGICFSLNAKANSAADAVKQNIVVEPVKGITDDFVRGVDISSLADVEANGGKFYNAAGQQEDIFKILKDNGVNWVRLRVWNKPVYEEDYTNQSTGKSVKKGQAYGGGNNSVDVDIPMAVRAKNAGLKLLVDFHYSDSWADPAKQKMPQEWAGLNEKQLNAKVEEFTRTSIEKFIAAGARPDAVQIGNELNNGFMWPLGKIWGDKNEKVGGMNGFITLLKSASKGVRGAQAKGDKIKVVVHIADGCNNGLYHSILDPIAEAKLDYDVIGLSYYNYWHGTNAELKKNLLDLNKSFGKETWVVETAYAFTEDDGDDQGNAFQVYSGDSEGYLASVQGQATSVRDVINTVYSAKGSGVFYWEPAWLPVKGAGLSATEGDTWENQAMFDFNGNALPSLAVWNLVGGKGEVTNKWGGSAKNGSGFVPYAITDSVKVTTLPGNDPVLPKFVKVVYTNDKEMPVMIVWDKHDWKSEPKGAVIKLNSKINGCSWAPVAEVEISTKVNLVADPSFESGKLGNWKLNGDGAACFMEDNKGNARTGKYTYKYWLGTGFKSMLSQEFTGLENGTYEASIWAMGGGGENQIRLMASGYDSANPKAQVSVKIVNTGWKEWKQYKVQIPVTNGKATLAIYLDTNAGNWGNFDDIEFVKLQ